MWMNNHEPEQVYAEFLKFDWSGMKPNENSANQSRLVGVLIIIEERQVHNRTGGGIGGGTGLRNKLGGMEKAEFTALCKKISLH